MYKNMAAIIVDDMARNKHDWWLYTQIKIPMPNWWKHRLSMHNMTKNR